MEELAEKVAKVVVLQLAFISLSLLATSSMVCSSVLNFLFFIYLLVCCSSIDCITRWRWRSWWIGSIWKVSFILFFKKKQVK